MGFVPVTWSHARFEASALSTIYSKGTEKKEICREAGSESRRASTREGYLGRRRRSYAKVLGPEAALAKLQKNAGAQFCPRTVEAFLAVVGQDTE